MSPDYYFMSFTHTALKINMFKENTLLVNGEALINFLKAYTFLKVFVGIETSRIQNIEKL